MPNIKSIIGSYAFNIQVGNLLLKRRQEINPAVRDPVAWLYCTLQLLDFCHDLKLPATYNFEKTSITLVTSDKGELIFRIFDEDSLRVFISVVGEYRLHESMRLKNYSSKIKKNAEELGCLDHINSITGGIQFSGKSVLDGYTEEAYFSLKLDMPAGTVNLPNLRQTVKTLYLVGMLSLQGGLLDSDGHFNNSIVEVNSYRHGLNTFEITDWDVYKDLLRFLTAEVLKSDLGLQSSLSPGSNCLYHSTVGSLAKGVHYLYANAVRCLKQGEDNDDKQQKLLNDRPHAAPGLHV